MLAQSPEFRNPFVLAESSQPATKGRLTPCGRAKIGLQNLTYNIRRFVTLEWIAVA
jgi:hypothetical protein